jgi:stress-induced morphogen
MISQAVECLKASFPESTIQVDDPRGDGLFLTISVHSPKFSNLAVVDQHRLVYRALKSVHDPEHLSIRTFL